MSTLMLPQHTKIEIDSENWPKDYWDKSLLCPDCDTNWPMEDHFIACPQCKVTCSVDKGTSPDMRWPDAVRILLEEEFDDFYDKWVEAQMDDEIQDYFSKMETAA